MRELYIDSRYQRNRERGKRRLRGSYTVEAAMVMPIVLLVILQIIKGAFFLHDQVRGTMVLQESIEQVRRGDWDGEFSEIQKQGNEKSAPLFYLPDYQVELKQYGPVYGGKAKSRLWEKEITIRGFNPEEFLRLVRGAVF